MARFRVGIIGCGGIGQNKHMPSLSKIENVEIVAFCDLIEERAQMCKEKFGTPDAFVCTDYKELLAIEDIEVVHVLTPNREHAQITVDALYAGKHVMCEKPMAHTSADAQAMLDAWRKSGKKFTIGYQNRFRPEVQMLHQCCENDELGEIYFAKAHAIRRRAVPTWGVFPNKALQGGGPLIDIGAHALDMTLWMMNNYEPVSVTGQVFYKLGNLQQATEGNMFGPWDPETYEVEDSAFGMIKFKNGAAIQLEASWALNVQTSREASTTLCGTKAGAEVYSGMSFPNNKLIINRGHNGMLTDEEVCGAGNVAYFEGGLGEEPGLAEARQWLNAILTDGEPLVKPEQAFKVTQILEAIYQSSATGKEVVLG